MRRSPAARFAPGLRPRATVHETRPPPKQPASRRRTLFVTSIHGRNFLLYPLTIWRQLEEKLAELPAIHRAKNKFLERVNYYGQDAAIDAQGRVLVPQILRDSAKLPGDVVVTGNIDHLVVSDRGALAKRLSTEDFGPEDYDELSKLLL